MTLLAASQKVQIVTGTFVCEAAAYADGDLVTDLLELANVHAGPGRGGMIEDVELSDKVAAGVDLDLLLFHTDPENTTFTKNSAVAIAVADLPKLIGVIPLTTHKDLGTGGVSYARSLGKSFVLPPASRTLYAALVARGAPTYSSTSDLALQLGLLLD